MRDRKARSQPSRWAPSWTRAFSVGSAFRSGSGKGPDGRSAGNEAAERYDLMDFNAHAAISRCRARSEPWTAQGQSPAVSSGHVVLSANMLAACPGAQEHAT